MKMTQLSMEQALEQYKDSIESIYIEKGYNDFYDTDIEIYINIRDKHERTLNSYYLCKVEDENAAKEKIEEIIDEYRYLGYEINYT